MRRSKKSMTWSPTRVKSSVRLRLHAMQCCSYLWTLILACVCARTCAVEIEENTDAARDNVEGALDNVREADAKRGYCACSKTKLICFGLFTLIVAILVLSLVLGLKK